MEPIMKLIGRTTRCAVLYRDSAFAEIGLTGTQHSYILAVCRDPGISQNQIAKSLLINKSNVTRQLNLLETGGFITRRQDSTNRRRIQIFPTDKAIEAYPRVLEVLGSWNQLILAGLEDSQKEQLFVLMQQVLKNAELVATGNLEDTL